MKKWILGFGFTVLTVVSYADAATAIVQAKLNALNSMTAQFSEIVRSKTREISRSKGSMALWRPGRFRWDTKTPMKQLVIADGKKMWVYDVELEQVTVKKQEKSLGGTPGLLLSGDNSQLAREFNVEEKGTGHYVLTAKSHHTNFRRVDLTFKGELMTDIDLYDALDQHTAVHLTDVKNNPSLPKKLFQFTPPKGVDVVE